MTAVIIEKLYKNEIDIFTDGYWWNTYSSQWVSGYGARDIFQCFGIPTSYFRITHPVEYSLVLQHLADALPSRWGERAIDPIMSACLENVRHV